MKKAVCIGINNYPGFFNDLKGCINDANDWSQLLQEYGFETRLILDEQATRQNVKAALAELVAEAGLGDVIVFTYSGHGTSVRDANSDEGDGYDEAISAHDGNILDDDLRATIKSIQPGATLVVVSDSCFSGTVTRLAPEGVGVPRYLRPTEIIMGPVRQHFLIPEADMPEILLTGCTDEEYSYDAEFDGRPNGAMSALAIKVIRENPGLTYRQFHAKLRELLPSNDYPQSPQLEGSETNKDRLLFEPLTELPEPDPAPEPLPEPEPEPEPQPGDPPGCLPGLMRQVKRFFKANG